MLRDAAAKRPGVLTKVGMGTYVDPRLEGGRMNEAARPDIVRVVEFGGEEWLHFTNFHPRVGIVRGTTADENGNISMEHEGAYLGNVEVALAARNAGGIVIAQVKRITARGSIHPQRVVVPSTLVDYVVVDPKQKQATEIDYDPALSGEVRRPEQLFDPVPFGPDKVIARRAAMELCAGDAVNLGFGISPLVPYILIEEGQGDAVTWAIEQGPVGGVPAPGFPFGCAYNAEAILPSLLPVHVFPGRRLRRGLLSFLEVGADGSVNVSKLGLRPHVTAGCGGFIDITARGSKLVFSGYFRAAGIELAIDGRQAAHRARGQIPQVRPGGRAGHVQRPPGAGAGAEVLYVTERCVVELRPEGLTVVEVAPGCRRRARRPAPGRLPAARRARPAARWIRASSTPRRCDSCCRRAGGTARDAVRGHAMSDPEPGTLLRLEREGARRAPGARPAREAQCAHARHGRRVSMRSAPARGRPRGARGAAALDVEPRAFCAGADVHEWSALGAEGMWRRWIAEGHRVFARLAALPMPTIAAIDGMAFGGGLELALSCDLRIAATAARFALPEVKIGIVPGWGGPARLAALVGTSRAKQMALTGTPIDADTALHWGLANEVVASDALHARALGARRGIAAGPALPVQVTKQLVDAAAGGAPPAMLDALAAGFICGTDDLAEGVAAFREKRPPRFNKR